MPEGIAILIIGQLFQIAYHRWHDREQNRLLRKIEENQRTLKQPL